MAHEHNYKLTALWTGNKGDGTKSIQTYDRSHAVSIQGKPELFLIMDNPAVGDKSKLNPEDLSSWSSTLYSPYIEINELRDYF